jgi:hypothetical protein
MPDESPLDTLLRQALSRTSDRTVHMWLAALLERGELAAGSGPPAKEPARVSPNKRAHVSLTDVMPAGPSHQTGPSRQK